jgi:hypothetical protein
MVRQIAADKGIDIIDLRLSQIDPVDLRGIPTIENGKTIWKVPSFLPSKGKGILFLDEINSAAQSTQAAAYQLVLDRKLGDYELPPGWSIIAAGNNMTDMAIVNQISSALKNRFVHIDVETDPDDWHAWAMSSKIDDTVIGFIHDHPQLLNEMQATGNKERDAKIRSTIRAANAFATPRTWEYASRLLKAGIDSMQAMNATIGAAAVEFMAYRKLHTKIPDLVKILDKLNGEAAAPEDSSLVYATILKLETMVTKKRVPAVFKYIEGFSKEYQVMFVKDMSMRPEADKIISETVQYRDWIMNNAAALAGGD